MADDLDVDALLDDLDGLCTDKPTTSPPRLIREPTRPPAAQVPKRTLPAAAPATVASIDDNLQSVLDELELDEPEPSPHQSGGTTRRTVPVQACTTASPGQGGAGRCEPTMLGGAATAMGQSSRGNAKACNMLRCITCDFKVCWFDGHRWDPNCDYLFFRNGCTDPVKLKPKLIADPTHRAYACQCAWASVSSPVSVGSTERVDKKWRCLPGNKAHP
eukprot:m.456724 g.456724  ORF g.456724 m.456724 type:complete len:217 (+) comp21111_c0_seq1:124-774(+)